jgi:hypothetical protein
VGDVTANPANQPPEQSNASPTGVRLSALETAAKRGVGPLSEQGQHVWHGNSRPCVSCGELVPRDATTCSECGQDLSPEMIAKMQSHAGPWYVHEHVRPFPGVTLERLIRQARRGILTTTTIVRGPTTHHQWRFAGETPGLAQHLGVCWHCQDPVTLDHAYCLSCGVHLGTTPEYSGAAGPAPRPALQHARPASELDQLSEALQQTRQAAPVEPARSRGIRVPAWAFVLAIVVLSIAGLLVVVRLREEATVTHFEQQTPQRTHATVPPAPSPEPSAEQPSANDGG